ncbi:uncharacterized protein LOC129296356 isoform X1 [Prosopis cineraria]|uniref:uncharacterized protein LOC129296356 isoform X1 n=1 Tax=Prosopis cineraria TaxID=364024 RepID=UPI00240F7FB9|nr:uncharacterized protein LOC129296356 isoform X1 [Prosopis cineraria]
METILQSLPLVTIPKAHHSSSSASSSAIFFHCNASSVACTSATRNFPKGFLSVCPSRAKDKSSLGALYASQAETPPTEAAERWLLVPVGDGDSRHIGFKVEMPGAYEIASSDVTVGRVPEKADLVIPVATVSGVHARIQKKGGDLLVTDLDSTNGTFVDDKKLRPGVVATVSSGSCITFGDIHLAMFRVSKIENVETEGKAEDEEETQVDSVTTPESTESS